MLQLTNQNQVYRRVHHLNGLESQFKCRGFKIIKQTNKMNTKAIKIKHLLRNMQFTSLPGWHVAINKYQRTVSNQKCC